MFHVRSNPQLPFNRQRLKNCSMSVSVLPHLPTLANWDKQVVFPFLKLHRFHPVLSVIPADSGVQQYVFTPAPSSCSQQIIAGKMSLFSFLQWASWADCCWVKEEVWLSPFGQKVGEMLFYRILQHQNIAFYREHLFKILKRMLEHIFKFHMQTEIYNIYE